MSTKEKLFYFATGFLTLALAAMLLNSFTDLNGWVIAGIAAVSVSWTHFYGWFKNSTHYTNHNRKLMHLGLVVLFGVIGILEASFGSGYWYLLALAMVAFSGYKIYSLSS